MNLNRTMKLDANSSGFGTGDLVCDDGLLVMLEGLWK